MPKNDEPRGLLDQMDALEKKRKQKRVGPKAKKADGQKERGSDLDLGRVW